jgi:hypothetical protein
MPRGRRPSGAALLERLPGSGEARRRLALVLDTLAGRRGVAEAGLLLGVSGRQVHALRERMLRAALASLEPRPVGRPGRQRAGAEGRVAELEAEVRRLRLDLQAAQIREEIALALPHLLRRRGWAKKTSRRRRQEPRPCNAGTPGT